MMRSDAELVRRTQLGDRDAFGILVEQHRARAVGLAMAMLGDFDEAEDVAQEALYQAYFGLDRLRDPARFGAWLCSIAVNLAKMALRRRRTTVSLEDLDGGRVARGFRLEDATPESEFEARELRRSVRRAIEQLPEDMRAAVWMRYVEGLSYQEIAGMFGIAPGTLRVQAHRARHKLREALLDEWQEYLWREEDTMIEVTVQDVLLWMPKDWEPKPAEGERHYPEAPPAKRTVMVLKERDGDQALPMWIGPHEGETLTLHLAEYQPMRPLTHDFIARLLDAAGVTVERVAVSALKGDTYFATVSVRSGQETREVDARPSDAINLAVRTGVPIFVDAEVMGQQGIPVVGLPDTLTEMGVQRGRPPEEGYTWPSGREIALAQKGV
ncbi:MAG TPA: bifunctional nuclease domain-containing protein [Anaerolineae bacterium]|nr:bifunctional nuclease domain-containing protein [Anaerolineae bacterium]